MVPAGAPTESTDRRRSERLLAAGDTIVDGGNTNFHDDVRRADALRAKQIHYVDAGDERRHLGPAGRLLPDGRRRGRQSASARADVPARSRRRTATSASATHGAGHYVKMVHNGIEYGLMQAYAEGFELMHASAS